MVRIQQTDESDVEYYNLQGLRVKNPQPGQVLIRRTSKAAEKIIY